MVTPEILYGVVNDPNLCRYQWQTNGDRHCESVTSPEAKDRLEISIDVENDPSGFAKVNT